MKRPTTERLRELFVYDPEAGTITRRIGVRGGGRKGSVIRGQQTKVDGVAYETSHVAWALHHGVWPSLLDHRDRQRGNNRIGNLRRATSQQNAWNRKLLRNSQTGVRGVTLDKSTGLYRARILIDGKRLSLGSFPTKEGAGEAYAAAAKKHFGEFAP